MISGFLNLPSSFTPEGQRQFKLDWEIKGEEGFANLSNEKWELQRDWLQGVKVKVLKKAFESEREKSIYKLVLKKEWTTDSKENFEEKGIQGALGLVKATWGNKEGSSDSGWELEEVTVNEKSKVWLIMAQGKSAMYLMPVVRASGFWVTKECKGNGTGGSKEENSASKEVNKRGVTEVKAWSEKFDWKEEWANGQDTELKGAMSSGFSITRTSEMAVFGWKASEEEEKTMGVRKVDGKTLEDWEERIRKGGTEIDYLYKNAGVLISEDKGNKNLYCFGGEAYFPLDLIVLGNIRVVKDQYGGDKVIIKDQITDVIGVRLDQVVII